MNFTYLIHIFLYTDYAQLTMEILNAFINISTQIKKNPIELSIWSLFGADEEDRTPYLLITNELLYLVSYISILSLYIVILSPFIKYQLYLQPLT